MAFIPEVETVSISKLVLDPKNPNRMNKEQIKALAKNINKYGFLIPVITNKEGLVADGHQRIEAAKSLGITEVPVLRLDVNEVDRKMLQQVMNKLKGNHVEALDKAIFTELHESENLGELSSLLGVGEHELTKLLLLEPKATPVDADEIPALRETKIQMGEVYSLGDHRLMCGDCTDYAQVSILMNGEKSRMVLTDPPYNTGMSGKKQGDSTWLSHMFNDSYTDDEWANLMKKSLAAHQEAQDNDTVAYVFLDWRRMHELIPWFKNVYQLSNMVVWDKVVHGLGSDYKYTYELLLVGKKGKPTLLTHQGTEYQDIWRVQREIGRNEDHATAKPTKLLTIPIRHATKKGEIVTDYFGGSGSTLMACEVMKRKCYTMEISPNYCQVIIDRWERFTGKKAIKIT